MNRGQLITYKQHQTVQTTPATSSIDFLAQSRAGIGWCEQDNLIDISGLLMYTQSMEPQLQQEFRVLLMDAAGRDLVTARRKNLLEILYHERYLTRAQLRYRVEDFLGKGCFGTSAWEDVFYRDMRVVKKAFQAAGYDMAYSRKNNYPGYYLRGEDAISPELAIRIAGSVADVDPQQMAVTRKLTPAERVQQGFALTDLAYRVGRYMQQSRHSVHG